MKILWVKCDFLHPTTKGGQIRTLEMLRGLHREHEIHFVAFSDPSSPEGPRRAPEYCTRSYPVPWQPPPRASFAFALQVVRNLFSPLPLSLDRYVSPAMQKLIGELRERERFDSIVCDFLSAAPNVSKLDECVLFEHNVETVIWERHAARSSFPIREYFALQARRMRRYEIDACRRAGSVVAVSEDDARTLNGLAGITGVTAIPTGVDVSYFAPPSEPAPRKADLVFVGSMDWMPNIDGVEWFVAEILPLIRRKRPDVTVAIVGRKPSTGILALAQRDPAIQVTGTVPDVRPWLWGASLSLVPLRVGGGTRLKIYEAMAARVPVVSTTVGAEGLESHPPLDIRIADAPAEFAAHCLELMDNPTLRSTIADAAFNMVSAKFSWEHVADCFSRLLTSVPD